MKTLLHIIATPRADASRTLCVARVFTEHFIRHHPGWRIDELNLATVTLPSLTAQRLDGKYVLLGGKDLPAELQKPWQEIIAEIERFRAADAYLVSAPMWNFGIPYPLKHYIDIIMQPKYLFQYTPAGPEGLIKNRKMVIITSRGGDYSAPAMRPFDLYEPYLRTVFGFAGITDITVICAQPMDMGDDLRTRALAAAQKTAQELAANL